MSPGGVEGGGQVEGHVRGKAAGKRRLLLFLLLAACRPQLTAESPAPPGRAARLDEVTDFWGIDHYRLELTQGVAIALSCDREGPCEHVRATSDAPGIAEIRPAALGALRPSGVSSGATAAAQVIVGKAVGKTKIHVRADRDHGGRWIDVTVLAAPPAH